MAGKTTSAVEAMATVKSGRVAVIGASGYGGLQTIRLLQGHPSLTVTFLGGERSAGKRWSSICSFLPLPDDPVVESADADHIAEAADYAVLSLPNGLACQLAPQLLERGVRVVDLSADFRYRSLEQWSQVYVQEAIGLSRDDAEVCRNAVYGLPEWMGLPSPRPGWWQHPVAFPPPA